MQSPSHDTRVRAARFEALAYTGHACKHAHRNATVNARTWENELLMIIERCSKICVFIIIIIIIIIIFLHAFLKSHKSMVSSKNKQSHITHDSLGFGDK